MHIKLPFIALAWLCGACSIFIYVPNILVTCALFVTSTVFLVVMRHKLLFIIFCIVLAASHASYAIYKHKLSLLPTYLENTKLSVSGTISSVVQETMNKNVKFIFEVREPTELARKVELTWHQPGISLEPGQRWQLTVKLKRPRGLVNNAGFDSEKYYFLHRLSAVGTVVKSASNVLLDAKWCINLLRQRLYHRIVNQYNTGEFYGIIAALTLGVKEGISEQQYLVLQNTGTAHLMAISGLHIGFVASSVMSIVKVVWRILPGRTILMPAPYLAAYFGIIASVIYSTISGFAVATQRALIMVSLLLVGFIFKRLIVRTDAFALSLILVLLWDPLAVVSMGFWLSFCAVACLLYAFSGRSMLPLPWRWIQPQLVVFFGLLPLSLVLFQQQSLVALIANLVAIPVVGFFVVPFALLGFVDSANYVLSILWPFLEYLNVVPSYVWTPPQSYLCCRVFAAILGFIWLFVPSGLPGRLWGILGFLPLVAGSAVRVPYAQAEFMLLDVGQGLSAVVRTTNHTLVFDTGNPGLGKIVIAPYLRQIGSKKIDTLIISHNDKDHTGGLESLLKVYQTDEILTSEPEKIADSIACVAGQIWEWDGVFFEVLHPQPYALNPKKNNLSCVLRVTANNERVLLTGDIESLSEYEILKQYSDKLRADILVVPHHGSKTSSSDLFIDAVKPVAALIPVGYLNQYSHPNPQVVARYIEREIPVYGTHIDGAIGLRLGAGALRPRCARLMHKPFWRME